MTFWKKAKETQKNLKTVQRGRLDEINLLQVMKTQELLVT